MKEKRERKRERERESSGISERAVGLFEAVRGGSHAVKPTGSRDVTALRKLRQGPPSGTFMVCNGVYWRVLFGPLSQGSQKRRVGSQSVT